MCQIVSAAYDLQMVTLYKDPDGEEYSKGSVPVSGAGITTGLDDVGTLKAEIAQLKAKINELDVSHNNYC